MHFRIPSVIFYALQVRLDGQWEMLLIHPQQHPFDQGELFLGDWVLAVHAEELLILMHPARERPLERQEFVAVGDEHAAKLPHQWARPSKYGARTLYELLLHQEFYEMNSYCL